MKVFFTIFALFTLSFAQMDDAMPPPPMDDMMTPPMDDMMMDDMKMDDMSHCMSPNHLSDMDLTGFEMAVAMEGNQCGIPAGADICCTADGFESLHNWYMEAKDHYIQQDLQYLDATPGGIDYKKVYALYGNYAEIAIDYFENFWTGYVGHNYEQSYRAINCNNAGRVMTAGIGCGFCAYDPMHIEMEHYGTNFDIHDTGCHELHEYCLPVYQQNMNSYSVLVDLTNQFGTDLFQAGMEKEMAESTRDNILSYLWWAFEGKMCEDYDDCTPEICLKGMGLGMVYNLIEPVEIDLMNMYFFNMQEYHASSMKREVENDIIPGTENAERRESTLIRKPLSETEKIALAMKNKRAGHMTRAMNYLVPHYSEDGFDVLRYGGFPEMYPNENGFATDAFSCNSKPLQLTMDGTLIGGASGAVEFAWGFVENEDTQDLPMDVAGYKVYYRFADWALDEEWRMLAQTTEQMQSIRAKNLVNFRGRCLLFFVDPIMEGECYAPLGVYASYCIPE